jgi:hypothetical protein
MASTEPKPAIRSESGCEYVTQGLFSSLKILQNFLDYLSHRIFRLICMEYKYR